MERETEGRGDSTEGRDSRLRLETERARQQPPPLSGQVDHLSAFVPLFRGMGKDARRTGIPYPMVPEPTLPYPTVP